MRPLTLGDNTSPSRKRRKRALSGSTPPSSKALLLGGSASAPTTSDTADDWESWNAAQSCWQHASEGPTMPSSWPDSEYASPVRSRAAPGPHRTDLSDTTTSQKSSKNRSSISGDQATTSGLPIYPNGSAAPSRLPAHKPVRIENPKHPLAPHGTPVYFKYGEEHYPEETVPETYTSTESDGTVCRFITNFLVYNKRGERLLPIEVLDQPRHSTLVLYGSLVPSTGNCMEKSRKGGSRKAKNEASTTTSSQALQDIPPYPVRAELAEWCMDYGQEPHNVPFVWLISRWEIFYRLERPAGRYISTFASAKLKFEVSTRIIKTLQWRPAMPYGVLVELLTAATRQEKRRKKQEWRTTLSDDEEQVDDSRRNKKTTRQFSSKLTSSLSSPRGTGVNVVFPDGQQAPLTPWGAPYPVEGVRESTLLNLTDFIESQTKHFLEGVASCPNILDTPFMHTFREKASLRRETLQLMEAKRRSIDSLSTMGAFGANSNQPFPPLSLPPLPPPYSISGVPLGNDEYLSASESPIMVGCPLVGAAVGLPLDETGSSSGHHHQMILMRTRQHEEQELAQLMDLLKEFSDPEVDEGCQQPLLCPSDDIISAPPPPDPLIECAQALMPSYIQGVAEPSSIE